MSGGVPELQVTWLGQAGFLLEANSARLLIDPWVSASEGRLIESPPLELVADRIDAVLVTHEHGDHLDHEFLRALVQRSPDAAIVVPTPIVDQVGELAHVRGVGPGERLAVAGWDVEVVPAWHAVEVENGYDDGDGRFVGYLVRVGSTTVYHAGDTIATDELLTTLAGKAVDVALLPVNGRDFFREREGLAGNLDAREAVLVARRIGASILVPYHWDAWRGNTVPPGRVADEAAGETPHVLCLARFVPFRLPA